MKMICAKCSSENIEAGEAGRRDHCADCLCESFVPAQPARETKAPVKLPTAMPAPAPAGNWFEQMRATVDANAPKK